MIYVTTLPQNLTPIENYPLKNSDNRIITAQEILDNLQSTIDYPYTLFIIGGLVNRGFTNNDLDIFIEEKINKGVQIEIEKCFIKMLKCSIHIINCELNEEKWSPVYLYKIYSNGLKQV